MICKADFRCGLLAFGLSALLLSCAQPEERPSPFEISQKALARGDGVTAESQLRAMLAQGHPPAEISAYLGQAALLQEDLTKARRWLGESTFSPGTAGLGFRLLGQLEFRDNRLAQAGAAFDRALTFEPHNAHLWTAIGHLRYRGGEQFQAIEAADRALAFDPDNSAALHFRAQLVRDSHGPRNALGWFWSALEASPDNVDMLIDYAATLTEAGEASAGLAVLRLVSEVSPRAPRLAYLNAVIAARGGEFGLARALLLRAPADEMETPAAALLSGIIDLELGHFASAALTFDRLAQREPDNQRVMHLLARALLLSGAEGELVARMSELAMERHASPYLRTMVGQALEALNRRAEAAVLLDAAARPAGLVLAPLPSRTLSAALRFGEVDNGAELRDFVRELLRTGETGRAVAKAGEFARRHSGSGDAQSLYGDALLANDELDLAIQAYGRAAQVRLDWPLTKRLMMAYIRKGDRRTGRETLGQYLSGGASDAAAAGIYSAMLAADGQFAAAADMLDSAIDHGARRDPTVLALRSEVASRLGDSAGASEFAWRAYKLQPLHPPAIQALARVSEDDALVARLERKLANLTTR